MSNEVVTADINLPFNVPMVLEEAKEQLNGIKLEYPVLKIPSAGSQFFEIDEEPVKELSGVIIYHGPKSMYYSTKYDGSINPPDCYSNDRTTGHKTVIDADGTVDIRDVACADCPYSEFGSDTESGGKACKEKHQLYILCNNRPVPFSLLLPVSSVGALNTYATKLFNQSKFLDQVITSFTLEKTKNKSGIEYSRIVMKKVRDLTADEITICKKYTANIKGDLV